MHKVGILGSGVVAKTLSNGFRQHGYDVRIGSRSADKAAVLANELGSAPARLATWPRGLIYSTARLC